MIPLDAHYETLGCQKGDSIQAVKKKYRKLAMEYHPDRIQSQGLPPELAAAAESKFKDIQNAYDEVEKHAGSRR
jgi:DnaJ like chaperone protein